jgi:hypothetical protein
MTERRSGLELGAASHILPLLVRNQPAWRKEAACENDSLTPTIFHEPWFLDAATNATYQEVTVTSAGRIVGRFPFTIARLPAGQFLCGMPELTHFLGPAIAAGAGSAVNRHLRRDGILRELLEKLPASSGVYQKLHRNIADTLVFQEFGYRTAVQFSYDIQPAPVDLLWSGMRDKTRNVIRRAEEQYRVDELPDPVRFLSIYQENLQQRGRVNYYSRMLSVCEAVLSRQRGRILAAVDSDGTVWQRSSIFGTHRPPTICSRRDGLNPAMVP